MVSPGHTPRGASAPRAQAARRRGSGAAVWSREGSALLPVLLLMLLFSAVALGLAVVVRVELSVADRFVHASEALYAAEAGLGAVLSELREVADWSVALDGTRRSTRSEGAFSGWKAVPGGGQVNVCCGPLSAAGRLAAETAASPLPARRSVQWQPFLWTAVQSLMPGDPASRLMLVVWVADDEVDDLADTTVDGNGVIIVRAEALAPDGLRRVVEAYVGRVRPGSGEEAAVQVLGWREVR